MVQTPRAAKTEVFYPDCDGQPVANNTEQFDLIVLIKENLEILFADEDVFIAGDLFWYPIEGNNRVAVAPDVMVALGRSKGMRYSYKQWEESNQPPQVIFEIISPSNTQVEMDRKLLFFNSYGVEEYYIYYPDENELRTWLRQEQGLDWVAHEGIWTSPQLGIRMDTTGEGLQIFRPDGEKFLTPQELSQKAEQERTRAEQERTRAEQEKVRADEAEQQLEAATQRLLDMGLTSEQVAEALQLKSP